MEKLIENDLNSASGFAIENIREESLRDAEMWSILKLAVADNKLSKDEQMLIRRIYGEQIGNKAINFIKENGPDKVSLKFESAINQVKKHPVNMRKKLISNLKKFIASIGDEDKRTIDMLNIIIDRLDLKREDLEKIRPWK